MKRRDTIIKRGDEILNLFEENRKFVPYILQSSNLCNEIISRRKISEGSQGKVYKIKFKNDPKRSYIMKRFDIDEVVPIEINRILSELERMNIKLNELTMNQFAEIVIEIYNIEGRISRKNLLKYNGLSSHDELTYEVLNDFFLPLIHIDCKMNYTLEYDKNVGTGEITVNENDYVCYSPIYSETILSLLLSQLLKEGICFHFIKFYATIKCERSMNSFLEPMTCTLARALIDKKDDLDSIVTPGLLFSVFISIFIMNDLYGICHNDLHLGNVLTKRSEEFESLKDCSSIQYNVNSLKFKFNLPEYICKIIDFGFGMKFSHPKVINALVVRFSDTVPNYDTKGVYDFFIFLFDIISATELKLNDEVKELIKMIFVYFFGDDSMINEILDENKNSDDTIEEILLRYPDIKLNFDFFKRIFNDFIVNENKIDSTFIAVEYQSNK
jgi:serine/threonine protein kinase